MARATARKFVVHVPWTTELRGGSRLCDLAAAIETARLHGVPSEAQVVARNALTGGLLRLTFTWQESLLTESLAQMGRGECIVIACPDCSASLAHPGHADGCTGGGHR